MYVSLGNLHTVVMAQTDCDIIKSTNLQIKGGRWRNLHTMVP
jgi:hypothetical protein